MMFNTMQKKWINISPTRGDAPAPRAAHIQLCFYNYIFVFGGIGTSDHIYGDLWVFDIIKQDWHMIMDSERTHELTHDGITGYIPSGRMFSSAVLFENFGAAVMIGGLTKEGVAGDIWALDLDMVVNLVEQPKKYKKENVWTRRQVEEGAESHLARYGHASGLINNRALLVFGGIDADSYAMRDIFSYDFISNIVTPLQESGVPPPTRIGHGLLSIGNGMMLLYGGEDPQGRGSFSDLWHIRVHLAENDVHYSQAKYKDDHEHYILSWRTGFTFAFMPVSQNPIMLGGTFGNNQQS